MFVCFQLNCKTEERIENWKNAKKKLFSINLCEAGSGVSITMDIFKKIFELCTVF